LLQTNGVSSDYGRWSPADEQAYRRALKIVQAVKSESSEIESGEGRLLCFGRQIWQQRPQAFPHLGMQPIVHPDREQLLSMGEAFLDRLARVRFGRLMAYLRERGPDDHINYSILVFRLSDAEAEEALYGPPPEYGGSAGAH
jgi:hypothetical protein